MNLFVCLEFLNNLFTSGFYTVEARAVNVFRLIVWIRQVRMFTETEVVEENNTSPMVICQYPCHLVPVVLGHDNDHIG